MLLKKAARCQPFLAVVRCLFHNHLRLKRSSLLNVYLNCKFEISLLTSHLFFSLFNLIGWIQAIKLRKREFDRLEKIQQFYQLTSCLLKMQRKNEVTIVFCFFSKTLKISAPNSFFPKNDKNLLFNGVLFQQVLLT